MIDFISLRDFPFCHLDHRLDDPQHRGSRGGSLVFRTVGRDHGATPWPQLLWKPAEAERDGLGPTSVPPVVLGPFDLTSMF